MLASGVTVVSLTAESQHHDRTFSENNIHSSWHFLEEDYKLFYSDNSVCVLPDFGKTIPMWPEKNILNV